LGDDGKLSRHRRRSPSAHSLEHRGGFAVGRSKPYRDRAYCFASDGAAEAIRKASRNVPAASSEGRLNVRPIEVATLEEQGLGTDFGQRRLETRKSRHPHGAVTAS
jgi:hypothetical protein